MKNISIFALIAALAATTASAEQTFKPTKSADGKCRALALSGGANYGAWEVGVMWGLVHYGDPADFTWDVITGVSAGAINTAATTVFAPGDELNMTQFLSDCWSNLHSSDIWQFWAGEGPARALFTKPGMLDTAPAIAFLHRILSGYTEFARRFTVAAVDASAGGYQTFDQDTIGLSELPQAAFASGSIPAVFPPQHFHGYVLMDGGTVWDVNVQSAINQCLEVVEKESDIIVDVLVCSESTRPTHEETSKHAYTDWMQAR